MIWQKMLPISSDGQNEKKNHTWKEIVTSILIE